MSDLAEHYKNKGYKVMGLQELVGRVKDLEADLKKANARERPAFEAGLDAGVDVNYFNCQDKEQAWQQYRCQDDTDWKSVKPPEDK